MFFAQAATAGDVFSTAGLAAGAYIAEVCTENNGK
jgi:hypothetical protein